MEILLGSNATIDEKILKRCDESYTTEDTKKKVSNTLIKQVSKNIFQNRSNLDIDCWKSTFRNNVLFPNSFLFSAYG